MIKRVFQHSRSRITAALLVCVAAGITACSKEAPPPQRPAVDVTALTVQPQDTPVIYEFVGQTQSSREVEIRARVDGFLERRVYIEGNLVKTGETLFLMDRKPFEATLQQARGELAQQQARLQVAEANLARVKPLAEQNAVSKKDLDDAIGNEQSTRAAVLAAEGSVRQAELNLGYATIQSPLTGLSSFAKLQDGAYINAQNSLLTYVAQLDPMWINFSISENELLRFRDQVAKGLLRPPRDNQFEVAIILADGTVYPNRGRISFADPSFSKETGTFLVRSTFANPKGTLKPGQFVRVHLFGATRPNAIVVPQRAVQQGAKSHFVWVVSKEGKAEQRVVETGEWSGDDWFINRGLLAGEQVVVDGAIRVAPGAPLKVAAYKASEGAAVAPARTSAAPTPGERAISDKGGKPAAKPGPERESKPAPLLAKVHFAFNQATLDEKARSTVAGVAAALKGTADRIEITGYADSKGPPGPNSRIAAARARAVLEALVAAGIAEERIRLRKPEQVVGGGDDDDARRVEIVPSAG